MTLGRSEFGLDRDTPVGPLCCARFDVYRIASVTAAWRSEGVDVDTFKTGKLRLKLVQLQEHVS